MKYKQATEGHNCIMSIVAHFALYFLSNLFIYAQKYYSSLLNAFIC